MRGGLEGGAKGVQNQKAQHNPGGIFQEAKAHGKEQVQGEVKYPSEKKMEGKINKANIAEIAQKAGEGALEGSTEGIKPDGVVHYEAETNIQ